MGFWGREERGQGIEKSSEAAVRGPANTVGHGGTFPPEQLVWLFPPEGVPEQSPLLNPGLSVIITDRGAKTCPLGRKKLPRAFRSPTKHLSPFSTLTSSRVSIEIHFRPLFYFYM